MPTHSSQLKFAIQRFWNTRESQALKQGSKSGQRDAGARTAVTGGAQMNGFVHLIRDLLEETPRSMQPVRAQEPHFKVFPEFKDASYAKRYEILLTKLLRERLYDATCLLLSDRKNGPKGRYRKPNSELSFEKFAQSLIARALSIKKT